MHFPNAAVEPSQELSSVQLKNSTSITTTDGASVLAALRTLLRLLATDIMKKLHEEPQP